MARSQGAVEGPSLRIQPHRASERSGTGESTGLEVDNLDPSAVRTYAETYLGLYRDALGSDLAAKGLNALLSDSIEAGAQNWTPALIDEFRRPRGYDPVPWFPALTGTVVESAERTDRFLWDYRRTISELLTRSHYAVLAAVAREHGLKCYSEALEGHRPQLGDDLAMRAAADVPMGAIWTTPRGQKSRQTFVADLQGAASVAHVHGKPLVAAETFTAFGAPWAFAPSDLKATADIAFALGVNRIMIHTSPHQPLTKLKPGMSLAPLLGQYFSRNETWGTWRQAGPIIWREARSCCSRAGRLPILPTLPGKRPRSRACTVRRPWTFPRAGVSTSSILAPCWKAHR